MVFVVVSCESSCAVGHLSACQTCTLHSRLNFVNVAFFDEEVVNFARLVHVYLDERASLCQSEASLTLALVQQSLFVLEVRAGNESYHLAQLKGRSKQKQKEGIKIILFNHFKAKEAEHKSLYSQTR